MSIETRHEGLVAALVKPGSDLVREKTPAKAHLDHMALGIAGEAGELVDAIKKHTIYGRDIDIENIIEELGDLEFYMKGLRMELHIERNETLEANIRKLSKRYGKTYSDEAAIVRRDKHPSERVGADAFDYDL